MMLAFDISGSALILDNSSSTVTSSEFAGVDILVDINPSQISNGTRVLDYSLPVASGQTVVVAQPSGPTVTTPIDFVYGQEFGVRVIFRTTALTDNGFLFFSSNPFFGHYGGGTIMSVDMDFKSTMELSAIVLPDGPSTTLSNSSPADYSGLIVDAVPEPSRDLLTIASLIALAVPARARRHA